MISATACWAWREGLTGNWCSTRRRTCQVPLSSETAHAGHREAAGRPGRRHQWRRCRRDDRRRNQRRHHRGWRQRRNHRRNGRRRQWWNHRRNRWRRQRRNHRRNYRWWRHGRWQRTGQGHWDTGHLRERRARNSTRSGGNLARRGLQALIPAGLGNTGAQRQGDTAQPGTDSSHSDAQSIKDRHQPPTPSFTVRHLRSNRCSRTSAIPSLRPPSERQRQFSDPRDSGGTRRTRPFPNSDVRYESVPVRVGNPLKKRRFRD
ncbi:Uncharacterised protein [Mycolicibacterium vanbaalenii]|uniref:Uncharacterized protein n=1 Tax=Mycolicibacterium vanbaalenii TaxID=110539 RepID=A0A5S9QRN0_MYCVN|nr:Uncharacterised protein [Mycolicibacterium vanbaalenii]